MPTRPSVIRVAGRDWSVVTADLSDIQAVGLCDPAAHTITLHPDQSLVNEQDTLLHEVMHAVLRQQGRTYTASEERYVTALATGLLGTLHDNPSLVRFLTRKRR